MVVEILYQDSDYVAVDKPSGLLVHPTRLARGARGSCMGELRDRLGRHVYPVHRLDRAASGVLLFGLSSEAAGKLNELFRERRVRKVYHAVVRGQVAAEGVIDKPLGEALRPALTRFRREGEVELPFAVGRYPTARYSLVRVEIETGRLHQIRRHFASLSHPLIGDTCYGDARHNRFFRECFGVRRLLLFASRLEFAHPGTGARVEIGAGRPAELDGLFTELGWSALEL